MKHSELLNQFREELSSLSREVEASVAMGHYDINKICEDVFCGVFRDLFGFENLRNLNEDEKQNFPGIDLADDEARVAIQVTSDKTLQKVKNSLKTIIDHGLYKKYDRVIFYILTRKQSSYSASGLNKICEKKLQFDPSSDILDLTDLASKAATVEPKILKQAVETLGAYMRGCDVGLSEQDFDPPHEPPETLSTNLLGVYFPESLYIGELLPDVLGSKRNRDQRKAVGQYIRSIERSVPSNYEVNSNKLITFHNLEDEDWKNPFSFLVDKGTVEPIDSRDYYSIDENHERVFKSLLRFCLQQKLYRHRVVWKNRERLFIFLPLKDEDNSREITWTGEKQATRAVFTRKFKRHEPDKVLSTRHSAFSVAFLTVGDEWYMSITPDWFFSFDGDYQKSAFSEDLISGMKRMEKNRSVFNQFRFLCAWLRELDGDDLFDMEASRQNQLTFGEVLQLRGGRSLNEDLWAPLAEPHGEDAEQKRLSLQ